MDWIEKAGAIDVHEKNYEWRQTIEEVHIQVFVDESTRARDILFQITTTTLTLGLKSAPNSPLVQGELSGSVKSKEAIWTLEENESKNGPGKKVVIVLEKVQKHSNWKSLFKGEEPIDPITSQEIDKKMMLKRFQNENPGFDFSSAEFTGQVPSDPANFLRFD
eukprot:TRINITY_DN2021_c0_g3_i3.p1 TRINITY_DN2021_c0_g3~~TRINITY_DN2021_c0_g3_i3.p1  ORF type:complete len:173 (-),score=56.65 TRINITY_DN2021_c0_g3_i3:201-689(-)